MREHNRKPGRLVARGIWAASGKKLQGRYAALVRARRPENERLLRRGME
jgi:hypothetical protein